MNQSERPTQKAPPLFVKNDPPIGLLGWVLRSRRWFRRLLIPYLFLIGLGGLLAIVVAGYGLAHANAADTAAFLLAVVGVAALGAAPALILRKQSQSKGVLVAQALVMLLMCGVIFLVLAAAFNMMIQPKLNRSSFETLASTVKTEYAGESPIMLLGHQVGIDVVTDITLRADLPLDHHGHAIARAMRGAGMMYHTMGQTSPAHAEMTSKGHIGSLNVLTLELSAVTVQMPDGRPLDVFPGFKDALEANSARKSNSAVVLPMGRYRKTVSYWFYGVTTVREQLIHKRVEEQQLPQQYLLPKRDTASGAPVAELDWRTLPDKLCKTNNPFAVGDDAAIGKLRGDETQWTTKVEAGESVSIHGPNQRGPYVGFATGAAVKAAFVPAAWARTHAEINLPGCDSVVAAVKEELARAAEKKPP